MISVFNDHWQKCSLFDYTVKVKQGLGSLSQVTYFFLRLVIVIEITLSSCSCGINFKLDSHSPCRMMFNLRRSMTRKSLYLDERKKKSLLMMMMLMKSWTVSGSRTWWEISTHSFISKQLNSIERREFTFCNFNSKHFVLHKKSCMREPVAL